MQKLQWLKVFDFNENDGQTTSVMMVHGGWVLKDMEFHFETGTSTPTICFIPDPNHDWGFEVVD